MADVERREAWESYVAKRGQLHRILAQNTAWLNEHPDCDLVGAQETEERAAFDLMVRAHETFRQQL